ENANPDLVGTGMVLCQPVVEGLEIGEFMQFVGRNRDGRHQSCPLDVSAAAAASGGGSSFANAGSSRSSLGRLRPNSVVNTERRPSMVAISRCSFSPPVGWMVNCRLCNFSRLPLGARATRNSERKGEAGSVEMR